MTDPDDWTERPRLADVMKGVLIAVGVVALLIVGFLIWAVYTLERAKEVTPEVSAEELDARPSMEQVRSEYIRMQDEIIAALDAEFGDVGWELDELLSESRDDCAGIEDPSAGRVELHGYFREGAYSAQEHERVLAIVNEVTGRYGFEPQEFNPEATADPDRLHAIVVRDDSDGSVRLAGAVNSSLQVSIGCHRWDDPTENTFR